MVKYSLYLVERRQEDRLSQENCVVVTRFLVVGDENLPLDFFNERYKCIKPDYLAVKQVGIIEGGEELSDVVEGIKSRNGGDFIDFLE